MKNKGCHHIRILSLVLLVCSFVAALFEMPIFASSTQSNSISESAPESASSNNSSSSSQNVQNAANVYIANYNVINSNGNEIYKVLPNDTIWVAVTIVDERRKEGDIGYITKENIDTYVQSRIVTGAFSPVSAGDITFNLRAPVNGCLSYTILFKDTIYQGNNPMFSFDVIQLDGNNQSTIPIITLSQIIAQCEDEKLENGTIVGKSIISTLAKATVNDDFVVSSTIANTGEDVIKDLVATISIDAAFAIETNSKYIGEFKTNTEKNTSFNFSVAPDAEPGVHTIKIAYSGTTNGQPISCNQEMSIKVVALERFSISDMQLPDNLIENKEDFIKITVVNMGKSPIYNVSYSLSAKNATRQQQKKYVGNIEKGTEESFEISTTPLESGVMNATLIVTYEDAEGSEKNLTEEITLTVIKAQENTGDDLVGLVPEPDNSTSEINIWMVVAILVFVIMLIVVLLQYTKFRRREIQILMEDSDAEESENR